MSDLAPFISRPASKPALTIDAPKWYAYKTGYDPVMVSKVWAEAVKQGVSPTLAVSLVAHESQFKMGALGKNKDGSTDWGLFQLNSRYHPQYRTDLDKHIAYGIKFLGDYVRRFGTISGLGYYNAGFKQDDLTQAKRATYVGQVMKAYQATQQALAGYAKIDPTFKMSPWGDADQAGGGGKP